MKILVFLASIFSSTVFAISSSTQPTFYVRYAAHLCYADDIQAELDRAVQKLQEKANAVCRVARATKISDTIYTNKKPSCVLEMEAEFSCSES